MAVNYVANLLSENNMQVDVLTGKPNYPKGKFFKGYGFFSKIVESNNKLNIYRLPIIPRGRRFRALGLILNYLSAVISFTFLGPIILRNQKYDIIFVYGNSPLTTAISALFFRYLKKIPVILWLQDLWPESIKASGYKLFPLLIIFIKKIINFIYQNVDLILCQSRSFISHLTKNHEIEKEKICLLRNTIDDIFRKNKEINLNLLPDELLKNESSFNILFTGNIGEAQSIETILGASEEVERAKKNINFVMVGGGSKLEIFKKEVLNRGLKKILFLDEHPWENMPSFINFCDVLLISLNDSEIFEKTIPNKLQSYLASGKPILGSLNGESAEIINESNSGISVESGDSIKLARKAILMSEMNKEELKKLGKNGEIYFDENFSKEIFLKQINIYFNILLK